jgi:hypothetical protein
MLKLNPDQLRQPYGGHQFYEHGLLIMGDNFDEVVEKLTDFRVNNNRPVGQPDQDILTYYLAHWPWMVIADGKPTVSQPTNKDYELWKKWIYKVWMNPPIKTVSSKEASDRWEICKKCPFNKKMDWEETIESTELARRAFLLRKGLTIPKGLGFCSLHHFDIGVVSFVEAPREMSGKSKDSADHPGCWV